MSTSSQTYHVPAQHGARHLWLMVVLWVCLHPVSGLIIDRFIDPIDQATTRIIGNILPDTRHYDDQINLPLQNRLAQVFVESGFIAVCLAVLPSLMILWLFPQHRTRWLLFLFLSWLVAGLVKHVLGNVFGLYYGIYFFQPAPITAPFVGLTLGLIQMRFFSFYSRQAYIWVLGTMVGYLFGEMASDVLESEQAQALAGNYAIYLYGNLMWGCYGLITGVTLWWLLRGMQFDARGKALPLAG